jgi:hypothetical protein
VNLSGIANRIATQTGLRHLLFLVAALLSILLIGYHFGTFDQVVHIPFLKANVDPSLYPGDEFIALRHTQLSYFWQLFQPFYRLGILEVTLFTAHFLATYLTFWAAWSLCMTLFRDGLAGLLTIAAFIFPHLGFLGFPVIEFSLLNRTFVLPFLLIAINLHLHKRYWAAFLLLGLLVNLHALSAGMVTAMLLFSMLLEVRRVGFARLFQAAGCWVIGAAPILLMGVNESQLVDWSLRPEWLSIVAHGILYQIFYPVAPIPYILLLTISGISAVGLYLIARSTKPPSDKDRIISHMLIAAGLIFALGIFTAQFLPVTVLIEMQLNRVSLFILVFACFYFANYLAQVYRTQSMHPACFALLAGTFIVGTLSVFPLAVWGLLRWLKPKHLNGGVAAVVVMLILGLCIPIVMSLGLWQPGIYIFARQTDWVDVQDWARKNTSLEAVFITPPEKGGVYESEWRVFSERSSVVSVIDLLEVALAPQYLETWRARFSRLAPGVEQQFNGNYFENNELASQAFYALTDQALLEAACTFQAEYLVVEKPHSRNFTALYENQSYVVYRLPSTAACQTNRNLMQPSQFAR